MQDYVIDAFNNDLPFDRLIEQLAADRLELGEDKRPAGGDGVPPLGRRFLNNPHDIDDRIDVVTRGMMGRPLSCARCHDHNDQYPPQTITAVRRVCQQPRAKDKPFISDSIDPVQRASERAQRPRRQPELRKGEYSRIRKQVKRQTGDYIWAAHRAAGVEAARSTNCTQIQARPGCDPALDEPLGQAPESPTRCSQSFALAAG